MNSNWSYSPETVKLGRDLCDLDLWPLTLTFAWTLLWSVVITPENFMTIRWWEHSQKGVTDRQTDGPTENTIHRAAWSQLKNRAPLLYHIKLCASFQNHRWIQTGVTVRKRPIRVIIGDFLSPEIWWMSLKNNRAPLLYYIKLCASFQSHGWIQTEVTVRKRSIRVRIDDFLSHVTLKFDRWPWKTIRHLFYASSSFVHHFISIIEFKLKLQSGNA